AELRGGAIEQARTYLAKLVGITVGNFPEWSQLRSFQAIRDCIVHSYGYVGFDEKRDKQIRGFVNKGTGVGITHDDRIALDSSFCQKHLAYIETFFKRLFAEAGWE